MARYYDGHYEETSMSLEEIEEKLIEEKSKSDSLKSWPDESN